MFLGIPKKLFGLPGLRGFGATVATTTAHSATSSHAENRSLNLGQVRVGAQQKPAPRAP